MTDGLHDLPEEEINPSFETLLKAAGELGKGADNALRDLAGEAAEAALSAPRLDMLARQAAKASGFALAVVRGAFDGAHAERQARKRADPLVAAAEAAARQAAQEAQRAARAAERERLRRECEQLAKDPQLLKKMEKAAQRLGVVGEGSATRGAYLAASSRLLRGGAISLLRRGAPAGGKNYLFTNVTVLMPEDSVITVSGASPMALIYYGDDEDALKHKVIVIAEAAAIATKSNGDEDALTIFLRTLLSEGRIDRYVAIPQQNGLPRTVHVRRNGPVALMLTSARENIDAEMLTRLMVSDTDETASQTLEIVRRKLGQRGADDPLTPLAEDELERWRDLQRWLEFDAPYDVDVPFQGAIWAAYVALIKQSPGALQLRMRRDITGFLAAIKASALVHRAQRIVAGDGRIVAEFADYANAWEAFDPGMTSLYGLRAREEIIAVVEAAERLGVPREDGSLSVKVTAAAMRKELGIGSNETAANRLREAVDIGALKEDDAKRGAGRGRPRYFWLLKTSADLRDAKPGGVFPSPDAVKKILEGGEGSETAVQNVQDVQDGVQMAPDRFSCTSYTSCTAHFGPSHPSTIFFDGPGAPPDGRSRGKGATAPISENNLSETRSAPPGGRLLSPQERVEAAEGLGFEFVLEQPVGFSWVYAPGVNLTDPLLKHAAAGIDAHRTGVEDFLRWRQARGGRHG